MPVLTRIFAEDRSPAKQLDRLRIIWIGGGMVIAWLGFAVSRLVFLIVIPLFVLVTWRLVGIRCPRCGARAFVRGIFYVGRSRCQKCGVRFE